METFLLNEGRNPGSLCVLFDQLLLNVGDFDEPAVEPSIDQGCLGTPAEGVAMLDCAARQQSTSGLDICSDNFVRVLNVLALVV